MSRTSYQEDVGKMLERVEKDSSSQFKQMAEASCFLRPTPGRVIVAQDDPVIASKYIHIPEKVKARPTTGRVIAVGEGCDYWMGKRVFFGLVSGIAIKFKNRPMWVALAEQEIVAEIVGNEAELDTETPLPLDGSYS